MANNTELEGQEAQVKTEILQDGDSIRIYIPDTYSDEQKVSLANEICHNIDSSCPTATLQDFKQEVRPGGVWRVSIDFNGNILVMNVNGQGIERDRKRMSDAVELALGGGKS